MKKKLGLALAATMITGTVFAGTPDVTFNLSAELKQSSSDDESSALEDENDENRSRRFAWRYARVQLKQKFSDTLSGTVKFRLNKGTSAKNSDTMGQDIDYAFIKHKMSDSSTLTVGKQKFKQGGWEGTYSSFNLYGATSHVRSKDNSASKSVGYKDGYFVTGVSYAIKTGYGKVDVQVGDPDQNNKEANSSGLLYGLRWEGKFMDGKLNPIVTYHGSQTTKQVDAAGTTTFDATTNTVTAVGLQYKADGLKFEIDQVMAAAPARSSATEDEKTTSTVLRVSKAFGMWEPILKYTISEFVDGTDADTNSYKQTDMAFTVMYNIDKKFAYYFGMNQEKMAPTVDGGKDVASGKTYVGFSSSF